MDTHAGQGQRPLRPAIPTRASSFLSLRSLARLLLCLTPLALPACAFRAARALPLERRIEPAARSACGPQVVLALDGIPHAELRALWERGAFPGFHPPAAMLAPFPSLTGPAHTDLWHERPVAGYEERYYDATRRAVRGGIAARLGMGSDDSPYHGRYGFEESKLHGGLIYLMRGPLSRLALGRLRAYLLETPGRRSALLNSTDALAHAAPAEELEAYLERVAAIVRELAARGERVTLVSDHGNDRRRSERVDLRAALRRAGLKAGAGGSVRPGRVVVPEYGLVGFAAVHAHPSDREAAAAALLSEPGVDLVVLAAGPHQALVLARRGRARVERVFGADEERFAYLPLEGDPLALGAARVLGADAWLDLTAQSAYPDAPRRLVRAVESELVRHPAALLVSLSDGYHAGAPLLSRVVTLRGTHGNLGARQSLGFVMTNWGTLDGTIRADDVHRYLEGSGSAPVAVVEAR